MSETLDELFATILTRRSSPRVGSYTAKLFSAGRTEIAKKVGEEAIEVIVAANAESDARVVSESADLIYHLMVLLAERRIDWRSVESELEARRSGARAHNREMN